MKINRVVCVLAVALFATSARGVSFGIDGHPVIYEHGGQVCFRVERYVFSHSVLSFLEWSRGIDERDVRLALRDVEDALTAWTSERQRQAALQNAVADSQRALQQATQLYKRGLCAYLPVLVAQRSLNQARDALALSQLAQLQGGIALYKALGAGWSDTGLASESDPSAAGEAAATQ